VTFGIAGYLEQKTNDRSFCTAPPAGLAVTAVTFAEKCRPFAGLQG
jgi:hypothetical protein